MTHSVGFSTGASYKFQSALGATTIMTLPMGQWSPLLAEMCFNDSEELSEFRAFSELCSKIPLLKNTLDESAWFSIHAPAKGIHYGNNSKTESVIDAITKMAQSTRIDRVVFHPDTIDESGWEILRDMHIKSMALLGLENSDSRKQFGKSVSDMSDVLDRIGCGLVLDLAHCFMNDPTMSLAYEFIERLGHRIVEIHLSGVIDGSHAPLFKTKQRSILEPILQISSTVPIIIESVCYSMEELKDEFRYVTDLLK